MSTHFHKIISKKDTIFRTFLKKVRFSLRTRAKTQKNANFFVSKMTNFRFASHKSPSCNLGKKRVPTAVGTLRVCVKIIRP